VFSTPHGLLTYGGGLTCVAQSALPCDDMIASAELIGANRFQISSRLKRYFEGLAADIVVLMA
jgi:hypothetical protein